MTPSPSTLYPDRYALFDRDKWQTLGEGTAYHLSPDDLDALRGLNDPTDTTDLAEIFAPLVHLIRTHRNHLTSLKTGMGDLLGTAPRKAPYIIGVAGSVAVGKSTFCRVLRQMLAQAFGPDGRVDLMCTDGFLWPLADLEERGLLSRKGFPESYDRRALLETLERIKDGEDHVEIPVYSHVTYDIDPDRKQVITSPDILIVEGLNVLEISTTGNPAAATHAGDYFDFTLYLDADETDIRTWYIHRFLTLKNSVFQNPESYFHRYAHLNDDEARILAGEIWANINAKVLEEHVAPSRFRADAILCKGKGHRVEKVAVRKP
ncbi:hypothetical protein TH25_03400 [Thalassospira profundimaris]|uniref:Pantothenate kinase n=1 Tax=Thalassospira profundimaris TaxID=502049 RepID=A0A367XKA5_9PROT|nr:type I pantothenate kinase [Thalassospira profundimaris]RCK53580.1 hypothetical protein TH25_03400 [Thalassospira profundimaris]